MAETLKSKYGPEVPRLIAEMISAKYRNFDSKKFISDSLKGYSALNLLQRGWHIAHALKTHLPASYPQAIKILLNSLGPKLDDTADLGMSSFMYMPHIFFVAEYGHDHFELSMLAQYELTQRFTAEFSIRSYLIKHKDRTLQQLKIWSSDPSEHVRRLVSEGTRPRLPWAIRLPEFQRDPTPVLNLLELLKDDPSLYVRRSVANNLNDIGKDNPEILVKTARAWLKGASKDRQWIVRHALRSALKRAEPGALELMGVGGKIEVSIHDSKVSPTTAKIGGEIEISFAVKSKAKQKQRLMVDFRIHYVKANGKPKAKVFKLKTLVLEPAQSVVLSKRVSLKEMTTRKHYPGEHLVEVVINGQAKELGKFLLLARQIDSFT